MLSAVEADLFATQARLAAEKTRRLSLMSEAAKVERQEDALRVAHPNTLWSLEAEFQSINSHEARLQSQLAAVEAELRRLPRGLPPDSPPGSGRGVERQGRPDRRRAP